MKIYSLGHSLKNPKLILFINIFIGILLIIAILFFIRDVVSIFVGSKEKVIKPEKKAEKVVKYTLQDYAPILKNNPFGFPGGEIKSLSSASGQSLSRSDVSLVGTVSGPKKLSYAIFMNKTGQQDVFRIGDSVFGIGTLKKVEKDRVFVNINGKDTDIPLADITIIKEVKATGTLFSGFASKTGEGLYVIDQRKIRKAIENPNEIMTHARLMPNIVDGRQEGFILSELKSGGIYQSLGLQNGDILLRVNEYNISSPEAALQTFTALKGMDRVQLDIIRNGAKLTMTYQIK